MAFGRHVTESIRITRETRERTLIVTENGMNDHCEKCRSQTIWISLVDAEMLATGGTDLRGDRRIHRITPDKKEVLYCMRSVLDRGGEI